MSIPHGLVFDEPPTKEASVQDFVHACLAAHKALCLGDYGAAVLRNESWSHALGREAAAHLVDCGLGRPKGEAPPSWIEFKRELDKMPSCAPDGLVQRADGLRVPISALPADP